jgi:hypothetical protein
MQCYQVGKKNLAHLVTRIDEMKKCGVVKVSYQAIKVDIGFVA